MIGKGNNIGYQSGKYVFVVLIFIGLIALLALNGTVKADVTPDHYVDSGGSNTSPYDTWAKAAHSIQDAIDVAGVGDTVHVAAGTYAENLVISTTINLTGADKTITIIDGGGSGNVVNISADYVNISGFTIQNSGSNWYDTGITIKSNYTNISHNIISNTHEAIYTPWYIYSHYNIIAYNTVSNNNYGIFLTNPSNYTIIGNTVDNHSTFSGIYLEYARNNTVSYNTLKDNNYGIAIAYSSSYNNTVSNNTIFSNNIGLELSLGPNNNTISGNMAILRIQTLMPVSAYLIRATTLSKGISHYITSAVSIWILLAATMLFIIIFSIIPIMLMMLGTILGILLRRRV